MSKLVYFLIFQNIHLLTTLIFWWLVKSISSTILFPITTQISSFSSNISARQTILNQYLKLIIFEIMILQQNLTARQKNQLLKTQKLYFNVKQWKILSSFFLHYQQNQGRKAGKIYRNIDLKAYNDKKFDLSIVKQIIKFQFQQLKYINLQILTQAFFYQYLKPKTLQSFNFSSSHGQYHFSNHCLCQYFQLLTQNIVVIRFSQIMPIQLFVNKLLLSFTSIEIKLIPIKYFNQFTVLTPLIFLFHFFNIFLLFESFTSKLYFDICKETMYNFSIKEILRILFLHHLILNRFSYLYINIQLKTSITKKMKSIKSIKIISRGSAGYESLEQRHSLASSPNSSSKIQSMKGDCFEQQVMEWFNQRGIEVGNPQDVKDSYQMQQRKLLNGHIVSLVFPDEICKKKNKN